MAKREEVITAEYVRQLLDYNEATGELIWKPRTPEMFVRTHRTPETYCRIWNKRCAGKVAGWSRRDGYRFVSIIIPHDLRRGDRKSSRSDYIYCRAHRIIWLIAYGRWPSNQLDHKDGCPQINRLSNLREAEHFENHQNAKFRKDNTSGITGVSWCKIMRKWYAYINYKTVRHKVGYFDNLNEATVARETAKADLHKFQPVQRT